MNHDLPREKKAFSMFRNSFDKVRINFERVGLAIEQVDKTIPSKNFKRYSLYHTACEHPTLETLIDISFYLPELFLKEMWDWSNTAIPIQHEI